MSYEVKQGNIFGRIGAGIGKGLAEQLPKETDRLRLTKGLKDFETEAPNLNPLQQATRLASIPGMTPEMMYTLGPFIKQIAQRREALEQSEKGGLPDEKKGMMMPSQNQPFSEIFSTSKSKFQGLKGKEATEAQLTPIQRMSPAQLDAAAARLSNEAPNLYPDLGSARQKIIDDENRIIQNIEEQRAVGQTADTIRQKIEANLLKRWGGEKTSKDIDPVIQRELIDRYETELSDPNNKKSEAQLEKEYGDLGRKIAKATTNLKSKAKEGVATAGPSKKIDTIKETRKVYKDAGLLKQFQDLVQSDFNISTPLAAYFTYPPSQEAEKIVKKYSKGFNKTATAAIPALAKKASIEAADEISKLDLNDQSLLALSEIAKESGLDGNVFFNRLKSNMDSGLFESNERFENERQIGLPNMPALQDFWLKLGL